MPLYLYTDDSFRPLTPWAFARLRRRFLRGATIPCAGDGPCPAVASQLILLGDPDELVALFLCSACFRDFRAQGEARGLVFREVGHG